MNIDLPTMVRIGVVPTSIILMFLKNYKNSFISRKYLRSCNYIDLKEMIQKSLNGDAIPNGGLQTR